MKSKNLSLLIIYTLVLLIYTMGTSYTNKEYYKSIDKQREIKPIDFKTECLKVNTDTMEIKQEFMKEKKSKAFQLLTNYVGKYSSNCYATSIKFIKELKGIEDYELVKINENELECGDLIFYEKSSYGVNHYGVYLDYEISFQPNWTNHKNIIGKVHYDTFSKPIYYRVERKEK